MSSEHEHEDYQGPGDKENDQGPGDKENDQGPGDNENDQGPGDKENDQGPGDKENGQVQDDKENGQDEKENDEGQDGVGSKKVDVTDINLPEKEHVEVFKLEGEVFHLEKISDEENDWISKSEGPVPIMFSFEKRGKTYSILSMEKREELLTEVEGNVEFPSDTKIYIASIIDQGSEFEVKEPTFGDWVDLRSKKAYGIGFQSPEDLVNFKTQFERCVYDLKITFNQDFIKQEVITSAFDDCGWDGKLKEGDNGKRQLRQKEYKKTQDSGNEGQGSGVKDQEGAVDKDQGSGGGKDQEGDNVRRRIRKRKDKKTQDSGNEGQGSGVKDQEGAVDKDQGSGGGKDQEGDNVRRRIRKKKNKKTQDSGNEGQGSGRKDQEGAGGKDQSSFIEQDDEDSSIGDGIPLTLAFMADTVNSAFEDNAWAIYLNERNNGTSGSRRKENEETQSLDDEDLDGSGGKDLDFVFEGNDNSGVGDGIPLTFGIVDDYDTDTIKTAEEFQQEQRQLVPMLEDKLRQRDERLLESKYKLEDLQKKAGLALEDINCILGDTKFHPLVKDLVKQNEKLKAKVDSNESLMVQKDNLLTKKEREIELLKQKKRQYELSVIYHQKFITDHIKETEAAAAAAAAAAKKPKRRRRY